MDKARVTEIGPDQYLLSVYVPEFNLRFNHFLIKDEEPLLFHTGMKRMFPLLREGITRLMDPAKIRWVAFSHYEADECGALNEWLEVAPGATALCGMVGALVSVNDMAIRPARVLAHDEVLETGRSRVRFRQTPHVPHNWEASMLFEEVSRTLLCSDLLTHEGDVEPVTESDIIGRAKQSLIEGQKGPFANPYPYTASTGPILEGLAELRPARLALMHGSVFVGEGGRVLREWASTMREVLGPEAGGKAY